MCFVSVKFSRARESAKLLLTLTCALARPIKWIQNQCERGTRDEGEIKRENEEEKIK